MARFENIEYDVIQEGAEYFVVFSLSQEDVKIPISWGQDARRLVESYVKAVVSGRAYNKGNTNGKSEADEALLNYLTVVAQKIWDTLEVYDSMKNVIEKLSLREGVDPELKQDTESIIRGLKPGNYFIPPSFHNVVRESTKYGMEELGQKVYNLIKPEIQSRTQKVRNFLLLIATVYDKHSDKRIISAPRSIIVPAKPMKEWYNL